MIALATYPHPTAGPFDDEKAAFTRVGLKAFARAATAWGLSNDEAAALADMAPRTWRRAKGEGWKGELTTDQLTRLSALIGLFKALGLYFDEPLAHQWPTLPNAGPLFAGARPVDAMIAGGLPMILAARSYVDALRGGV